MPESGKWYAAVVTVAYCCFLSVRRLKVRAIDRRDAVEKISRRLSSDGPKGLTKLVEVKKITIVKQR